MIVVKSTAFERMLHASDDIIFYDYKILVFLLYWVDFFLYLREKDTQIELVFWWFMAFILLYFGLLAYGHNMWHKRYLCWVGTSSNICVLCILEYICDAHTDSSFMTTVNRIAGWNFCGTIQQFRLLEYRHIHFTAFDLCLCFICTNTILLSYFQSPVSAVCWHAAHIKAYMLGLSAYVLYTVCTEANAQIRFFYAAMWKSNINKNKKVGEHIERATFKTGANIAEHTHTRTKNKQQTSTVFVLTLCDVQLTQYA